MKRSTRYVIDNLMKSLVNIIKEYYDPRSGAHRDDEQYFDPRSGYGESTSDNSPKRATKEDEINAICSNFAYRVSQMLKNYKGTDRITANKNLERAAQHLYDKASKMDGGKFVKEFVKYIEEF